ncbi:hypothetical protein N7532_004071 [Penicillium argentinense]|uniref:AT DNA binding protein n=1 Tax=Penicillium argentinense TaxID=1131581 RepID=A0A9W9FNP0_9EURO|nr:uncharacterized protein N7532_004071 [Penicillium argentinense]KAJ5103542.1 hypothetical protein N7532_004071 [Penicillium argentinense]
MEPTDDHEEFDSIMESEGFTMVSLDTLPSAQQIGLGSHASRASDNAAKVLQDRDNGKIGDRLKRKLPGGITDLRSEHSSARASPAVKEFSPGSLLRSRQEGNRSVKPPPANDSPKRQFSSPIGRQSKNAGKPSPQPVSYPDLPPTSSPAKHRPSYRSEEQYEDEEEGDEGQYEGEDDEGVFEDFAPKNEAVVLDDIEEEEEDVEEVDVNEEEDNEEEDNEEEVHIVPHSSEFEQAQSPRDQAFSARSQQEARWHEERLNVSRHAQNAADSNRMIYIDSDENVSDEERIQSNDLAHDRWQSDVESVVDEEVEQPEEPEEPEELDEPEDIAGHEDREQSEGPEGLGPDDEPATLSEQDVPEDIERFKEEDLDGFGESDQDRQSKTKPVPSTFIDQNRTVQREASEDVDDGYDDIWRQEPENSRSEHRQAREPEQPANRAWATEYDEDDAFDDIWQQEARDNSYLSQQSDHRAHQPVEEAVSPWREIAEDSSNQNRLGSSPAYVNLEKYDLRHLNPTQIRKLREREVDLSALLAADDTPNRARYYNGTSTPRSILSRHSAAQHSSASKSSSHKPEKRVRLQPLSQSPEREPEAEQESPVFRHNYSRQESLPDEVHEIGSASDGGSFEDEPAEGMTTTPRRQSQPDVEPQGSTWFQRITSLTPRWLKAPNQADDDESSEASQDEHVEASDEETEDDQVDKGELSLQSPQEHHQSHEDTPRSHRSSESPFVYQKTPASAKPANSRQRYETSQVRSLEADDEASDDFERRASGDAADELVGLDEEAHDRPKGPRPLAVFGYFSNEHYLALRRIYRMAKRHPGRLPYHNAPGRAQIIGDWIWTSDGLHGVPISEAQFAIIDRFVQELSHADVQYGGSGQVEWTDADLHRRLISIIIGEQIREERKVQANRGASVDTWR